MNRIEQSLKVHQAAAVETNIAASVVSRAMDSRTLLFGPLHYEPNYAYPLIVWLHGPGDDARGLRRIMPLVSMRNYVAAAPEGVVARERRPGNAASWPQDEAGILSAEQGVFDAVASASARFHIAPDRVFLAGFDCGGVMAFRVAFNHPRRFAGVVSLCGAFPQDRTPLGQWAEVRRLRVLLTCGRDSVSFSPSLAAVSSRLLHCAGLDVTMRPYACGQEIAPAMLADMDRWIMRQVCG